MTGPQDSTNTRPISVAELLAKNGTIGAPPPVTGRRRRRRGNDDAVTVAELTGEIPVIEDDAEHDETEQRGPGTRPRLANGAARIDEAEVDEPQGKTPYWAEPGPRWPQSPPPRVRDTRPERSPFPLPTRNSVRPDARDPADRPAPRSGAEGMNPDPLEDYAGMPVDVMDTDVRDAEPVAEDSAYVRSYLGAPEGRAPRAEPDDVADLADIEDEDYRDDEDYAADDDAEDFHDDVDDVEHFEEWPSRTEIMLRGGAVVLQSFLAVAFGALLFIAFDQLWRWNNIVALVLSVLVILGLVVGVRVVRRTEDIGSTLTAVAVGALVTLGPLALSQSG
ncbi:hypothetical protein H7K24_19390 [Mycobacterium fragae]|uniref:FUSC family protein n=1 Tax=Mycobacterium fragae TaxID=1260918 RepID=A0A1X1USC5_9MYCO|nr:hypothetical protein [Mycobacterium fragae]MCV7402305.1 hypothetical protein [Mycobacterium fragae]ORV59687.1 hypothetical protein AWC06_16325 [Mycobacterium fragae]